ncbi:tRNA uridine-5-carboxymethylaminomethyl(34) synthesis enzyme MnmG [bacterium]|nr:tRNA uridine-5-carboxymethylaminomethyl(34) synthesis enzyme MnmG [bacterium]|tara:strand:- start:5118 stop:7004 length:1887 start_codon:yes stop_codon:yes gene_type:complete
MNLNEFDVIVVGGGHAGCEAALSSARLKTKTLLLTANLDTIGIMSCNPSIGGVGKGHLVREIDALGGEMGKAADFSSIQYRRLNTKKGPAVQATRVQADRNLYRVHMKQAIENQTNLFVKQRLIHSLLEKNGEIIGVQTSYGEIYSCKCLVITPGTFPNGLIHVGTEQTSAGRAGEAPTTEISDSFKELGLNVARLKTGTPPRLDGKTIDWSKTIEQPADENPLLFSFENLDVRNPQLPCHITYTNAKTHKIIKDNLHRSPMYSGQIEGVGPRYCPSIEDKIVKFADRERHQVFLEPEGLNTKEIYPNGISTSLPIDVQIKIINSIEGLENTDIMRPGYAVEYDYCDPRDLRASLESKKIKNLYMAGQINGTTGYEEAAAQGLIAGINSSLRVHGADPLILKRSESYIGILIDDLVTLGVDEPYRMFTSRAEHRLLLRDDNADFRLTPIGYEIGLIKQKRFDLFNEKRNSFNEIMEELNNSKIVPNEKNNTFLSKLGTPSLKKPTSFKEILRRPEVFYDSLIELNTGLNKIDDKIVQSLIENEIKYEGYIARQNAGIEQISKHQSIKIPSSLNINVIPGLSNELKSKLNRIQPETIGQASRISGITPAAINILMIYIKKDQSINEVKI